MNLTGSIGGPATDEPVLRPWGSVKSLGIVFGVLVLLLLGGQAWLQASLAAQAGDGRVINLAGRQRMLSQKLARMALVIVSPTNSVPRDPMLTELKATIGDWARNQELLQPGSSAAGLQPRNSPANQALYASIQPHHEAILRAARQIEEHLSLAEAQIPEARAAAEAILRVEPSFLSGMEAIVRNYELENQARVTRLRRVEAVLSAGMWIIVAFGFYALVSLRNSLSPNPAPPPSPQP